MKKRYFIISTALFLLGGFYLSTTELPKGFSKNKLLNLSKKFVLNLNNHNYSQCYNCFNNTMKRAMSQEKLTEICEPVLQSLGDFVRFKGFTFSPVKEHNSSYVVCTVNCVYTKGTASFLISYTSDMEVGGLYIK